LISVQFVFVCLLDKGFLCVYVFFWIKGLEKALEEEGPEELMSLDKFEELSKDQKRKHLGKILRIIGFFFFFFFDIGKVKEEYL